MRWTYCLQAVVHLAILSQGSSHSRKRRYLAFPDKSNLALTITLLKPTAFMNGVNTLHEIDFSVPLPRNLHSIVNRDETGARKKSSRDRQVLYGQIEAALDMYGLNGASCLERLMCEVQYLKVEEVKNSVVLKILQTIFTLEGHNVERKIPDSNTLVYRRLLTYYMSRIRVADLRKELEGSDLDTSGTKSVLRQRLCQAIIDAGEDPEHEFRNFSSKLETSLNNELLDNSKKLENTLLDQSATLENFGMLIENVKKDPQTKLFEKLGITEETLREDVRHLKEWMQKQPHLPIMRHVNIDSWLENQLIMSKNSLEKTKNSIERYCSVRSICPDYFSGSQFINQTIENSFSNLTISYLPGLTPRLHKACIVRLESPECEEFYFEYHLKRCLMVMDYYLLNGQDFTGFHVIFDLANFKLGHLARFHVTAMRIMSYAMKAYPVSFTIINIVNYPPFVEKALALFKPFISSKLYSRIVLIKDVNDLRESLGNEVTIPAEYGGSGLTQKEYSDIMKNNIIGIKDYLLECDKIRCDDSKRLSKDPPVLIDTGIHGSFRKLCID